MPVVGCPKCKKKYKLAEKMLGKTVRCSACQTPFKPAVGSKTKSRDKAKADGAKPRKKKRSQDSEESLKDVGLSGKLNPQLDLFSQPIPDQRTANPLGNHVMEDPGFGQMRIDDDDDDDDFEVSDSSQEFLANPALKAVEKSRGKGKKKAQRVIGRPSDFKDIRTLGYVVVGIGGIAMLCYLISAIFGIVNVIQLNNPDTELLSENMVGIGTFIWVVGLGFSMLSHFVGLFYWARASANVTALGATGQSYTPMWMVLSWFIPFVNVVWPVQGISETYRASKRPIGKKWQKLKENPWEVSVWTIAVVISTLSLNYATSDWDGGELTFIQALAHLVSVLLAVLSVYCILSMVMKVTKAQYANFES